jgi:phosphotransacetylase
MKQIYKTNFQYHKLFLVCAVVSVFSSPVFADNKNVEEAITLLKKTYPEQCQKNKLKKKLLIAHREHDQNTLKELGAKLDEINQILKPTDEKLANLKAAIKKNPDDEADFNTALLDLSACE